MVSAFSGVRVRDEVIEAPLVISTVPWHAFHALFDDVPAGLEQTIANATALASLPIVTVNLWFDAAVMHEPLVGLPGRQLPVDLRSPRHRRRRRVAPLPDLERRGSDRRANQRRADGDCAR